jgi:hypothetical protein
MFTADLPPHLQEKFLKTAESLYGEDQAQRALIEAVELWLDQNQLRAIEIEAEQNNQAFAQLQAELEQKYDGQWIVIDQGRLQGVGNTLPEVNDLALDAKHRIIMQIGRKYPEEVELGWQMSFA